MKRNQKFCTEKTHKKPISILTTKFRKQITYIVDRKKSLWKITDEKEGTHTWYERTQKNVRNIKEQFPPVNFTTVTIEIFRLLRTEKSQITTKKISKNDNNDEDNKQSTERI